MLAACFAYLAYRQGDRVGLFAYGQEVEQWIRPKSGHAHFGRIVNALSRLQAGGVNKHEAMWDQLVGNMPGRSTVVFLSDFLEAEDILPERLRFALSSRYEALCLQVLDREEENSLPGMPCVLWKWKGLGKYRLPQVIRDEFSNRMNEFKDTLERNLSSVSGNLKVCTPIRI